MDYSLSANANGVPPNSKRKRKLGPEFRPGPHDVICARGREAHDHEGNVRFRSLVQLHQQAYASASTKYHKSQIVSHITHTVRKASPEGGFVKLIKGSYYEIGDRAAKEKIGQAFRDLLHTKYTSSTKAKAEVRIKRRLEQYRSERLSRESQSSGQEAKQSREGSEDSVGSSVSVVSDTSSDTNKSSGSKEWSDSLRLILGEPFAPELNRAPTLASTTGRSIILPQVDKKAENQAPEESLRGSLSYLLDQRSPLGTFAMPLATSIPQKLNSSSAMANHSSPTIARPNSSEVNKRSYGTSPTEVKINDESLFDSLSLILDHPYPITGLESLEPVPLQEEHSISKVTRKHNHLQNTSPDECKPSYQV